MKKDNFLFYIFLVLLIYIQSFSQQFSQDIIIEESYLGYVNAPVIGIDHNNNIAVLWQNVIDTLDVFKYVESLNGGTTFDSIRIVDQFRQYFEEIYGGTSFIKYDAFNNPLVSYFIRTYPASDYHFIKKSSDGGLSFPSDCTRVITTQPYTDFLFLDDTTGIMAFAHSSNIHVYKTLDGGDSFFYLSKVDTNTRPNHNVSLVETGNHNLICFWSKSSMYYHDTYYSISSDLGMSFAPMIKLDSTHHHSYGVDAVAYKNYVFVVYCGLRDSLGIKVILNKSTDYGQTYVGEKILYDYGNTSLGYSVAPSIEFHPAVGLCVVWGHDDILFTRSKDFGVTFDSTVIVATGTMGLNRYRSHQSMAISDSGDISVVSLRNDPNHYQYIVMNKARLPLLTKFEISDIYKNETYILNQNYPNPFNNQTTISFYLPKSENVEIEIYDINGRLVNTLLTRKLNWGLHSIIWNGLNADGQEVSSGIYLYHIKTKDYSQTRKLVLLK